MATTVTPSRPRRHLNVVDSETGEVVGCVHKVSMDSGIDDLAVVKLYTYLTAAMRPALREALLLDDEEDQAGLHIPIGSTRPPRPAPTTPPPPPDKVDKGLGGGR